MNATRSMLGTRLFLFVLVALATVGCAASSVMSAAPPRELPVPTAGVATFVFMRPTTFGFSLKFRVIDHAGRFVGDSLPDSYFVVRSQPGEYVFILGDDDIDVLYVNAAPGVVYYVEIAPVPGSFKAKTIFRPVKPRDGTWNDLPNRLSRSRELVPDFPRGQASVDRDSAVRAKIERAKAVWAALTPSERALQSIGPGEGAALAVPPYAVPLQSP